MSTTLLLDADAGREASVSVVAARGGAAERGGRTPMAGRMFKDVLGDAVCLLGYAAETGVVVEADLAQRILEAEQRCDAAWDAASAGSLLSDITKLGALLQPVTAATLRASKEQAHAAIRTYKWMAVVLFAFVIPWSVMSFVFTEINKSIAADIASANELVVALHDKLDIRTVPTSASQAAEAAQVELSALSDMQQFAATIRSIYRHTRALTWFVAGVDKDPVTNETKLELETDLSPETDRMRANLNELTASYQLVRSYAKYTQDDGAAVYGAITASILPVFYALLGACAYLLRVFSSQLAARTFAPSYSTVARFVIAAIAGGVIGLFNKIGAEQTATLSPLAIAFLAGYAADVFFSFIDGAVHTVGNSKAP